MTPFHISSIPQSVYLHYPLCRHVCSYCDFNVARAADFSLSWWEMCSKHLQSLLGSQHRGQLQTLYLGGGTPSLMELSELEALRKGLACYYDFDSLREFTIECNPESLSRAYLQGLKELCVNRVSLGVQSFLPNQLRRLERLSTAKKIDEALNWVTEYFTNYSLDLMIGIPDQDFESLQSDIQRVLDLQPPHISIYMLSLPEGHRMKTKNSMAKRLVGEDRLARMYELVCDALANDYEHYEVSNFAKPGFRSVHNQNYWNANSSYLALGPGAHGYIWGDGPIRYWNEHRLGAWEQSEHGVEGYENITAEQTQLEELYLSLRTRSPVETTKLRQTQYLPLVESGLLECGPSGLQIPEKNWILLDSIAERLCA